MLLEMGDARVADEWKPRPKSRRLRQWTIVTPIASLLGYGFWGLTIPRGGLTVISEPAEATVRVDSWFEGPAPFRVSLPVGQHRVVVRAAGRQSQEYSVSLGAEPTLLVAKLQAHSEPQ
jgi:hypothetical protein